MRLPRRKFLHLAAGVVAVPVLSRPASALDYPTRPVRIIVGYPPAGSNDVTARLVAQWLSQRLGQPFVIENRPGAGTNVATELVVQAPADGYTLLLVGSSAAINATLYDNLKFNFIHDITPVAGISSAPGVMLVNRTFPAKTIPEFIAYAKANPGRINMATAGIGSGPHVYGELFKMMTGVDLLTVHYRGGGPALIDLLGGQVQVLFEPIVSSIEYIKANKLRALAVTSAKRSTALPDIPTVGEFVPGYEASGFYGIGAPKNTPVDIIDKLNEEISAAVANPEMQGRLTDLGGIPMPMTPAEFGKLIVDETEKWAKVIKFANIKAE